jgi:antirestriction protein ArdC
MKTQELHDKITQMLQEYDYEKWLDFLNFSTKFKQYSMINQFLIHYQFPQASYVKGYKAWQKLGRYVKKGEKAIQIYAPRFKKITDKKKDATGKIQYDPSGHPIEEEKQALTGFTCVSVFDVSQTEGEEGTLPEPLDIQINGIAESGDYSKVLNQFLIEIKKELPVYMDSKHDNGYYLLKEKEIHLNPNKNNSSKIETLIHEYTHHLHIQKHGGSDCDANSQEFVAESVSYLICNRIGIDTSKYAAPYLLNYSSKQANLTHLIKDIEVIYNDIQKKLRLDQTKQKELVAC